MGKYECKLLISNHEKIIFRLTGTKNNGPLKSHYYDSDNGVGYGYAYAYLIYKNKGGKEIRRMVHLTQFSHDGKVWFRGSKIEIRGEESIYLGVEDSPYHDSDGDGNKKENIDISKYQYAQLLFEPVQYNFKGTMLRLNLTTGQAMTGYFTKQKNGKWRILWDGDIL